MNRRVLSILLLCLFGGVILFCHTTVKGVVREASYPFVRITHWIQSQIGVRWIAAWRGLCDGVERANADAELERLRVLLNSTEAIALENLELRTALEWRPRIHPEARVAPILSYGGGLGVWPRLVLGIGSEQGISEGDTVVVPEGLVGRIGEGVTKHTCEVILLSDPGCRVAAEIPGVAKGIVQGTRGTDFAETPEEGLLYHPDPLHLRYIDTHARIAPRQVVLTEGSGELFPRGLTIGTITTLITPEENAGLMLEAEIAPAVDPRLLRIVFILPRKHEAPL